MSASCAQALVSTVLSLLFALPLAHCVYRFDFWGKRLLLACASIWFIMPTKLVAIIVADCFFLQGFAGIVVSHLLLNMTFAAYLLYLCYQKIDLTLLWSAQQLGATQWRCYIDIVVPLLRPTIISTAILIFLLCFSTFSIPLIIGNAYYHQTPELMLYTCYQEGATWATIGWFMSRLLVIIPISLLYQKKKRFSVLVCHITHEQQATWYRPYEHSWFWLAYLLCASCFMVVPLIALLVTAINAGAFSFLQGILLWRADMRLGVSLYHVIGLSLLLASTSSIGALCIGFVLCRMTMQSGMRRYMIGSGVSIVSFILGAVGCGILFAWLSHMALLISYKSIMPFVIAAVCHIILNYPFVYRVIAAQLSLYQPEWRSSAHSLGASRMQVMHTIEVPFIRAALIKALCVTFGLSLTEVGAATVLQEKIGITLPRAIRLYRAQGANDAVLGLSLLLLGIVFVLSFGMSRGKKF